MNAIKLEAHVRSFTDQKLASQQERITGAYKTQAVLFSGLDHKGAFNALHLSIQRAISRQEGKEPVAVVEQNDCLSFASVMREYEKIQRMLLYSTMLAVENKRRELVLA